MDRESRLMEEMTNYLNRILEEEPETSIIISIDANATLKRHIPN